MKQFEIMNAYKMLETLSENENLDAKEQWSLYKVRKQLRPHAEFQQEREEAIQAKYKEFADEEGNIKGEPALKFYQDIQALGNMDIEVEETEKPTISIVKGITLKQIEPLEAFIEFIPPAE